MSANQILITVAAFIAFVATELVYGWWSQVPGFFPLFGFVVCVMLIVFGKGLGSWLKRPENYYDREDRVE
jgi:hypothetical protein